MAFAENLKLIRKERNVTQEELAELLGVSRQAISKWESGNGYPETEKLISISKILNISIDYLLNEKSNIEQKETDDSKTVLYAPNGRIAISTYDNKSVVMCQAVKTTKILFHGNGPKYILYGIDGVSFWGEHTTILGWYKNDEDIQQEIKEIAEAITQGKTQYTLKYYKNIKFKGIFGQPTIID